VAAPLEAEASRGVGFDWHPFYSLQTLRSKTMKHLMVVIIALLIPVTAMAKNPCKEDKQKFCKHVAHVGACLDQHKAELSEACKAKRERKANAKKASEESAKMGKEEGTHAQPGAQPLTKEACKKAGLKWNDQSNVCG
jgi:hypothetical protein